MKIKLSILILLFFIASECRSEDSDSSQTKRVESSKNDSQFAQLLFPQKRLWDSSIAPVNFTTEQENQLMDANVSPPAKAFRNALNDFLAGKTESDYFSKSALGSEKNNLERGLSVFNKEYLSGKFLILTFNEKPTGDLEIILLPQSSPERIFIALMHNKGTLNNEIYELIDFYNSSFTENEIHQTRNKFIKYVKDPKYGI